MNEINKKLDKKNIYNAADLKKIIIMIDDCSKLIDLCNIKYELLFKLNKWLSIEAKSKKIYK